MRHQGIETKLAVLFLLPLLVCAGLAGDNDDKQPIPTHADAAVILAKYSGLFDRYISPDATLNECVGFLNKTGVYFGLMEVVGGKVFTVTDCARVMGQIELVFSGEAEYVGGKVKLPANIDSWEEFCIINAVEYTQGYITIVEALKYIRQFE